jgi:hypothetical protein
MTSPILLTETMLEETTGFYTFTLDTDMAFLSTLTVTLHDVDSGQVVNGRDAQNILNANGGTVTTSPGPPVVTTVTFELAPDDTILVNPARRVEYRLLIFRWTWNSGQRAGAHAVQFGIEQTLVFP